MLRGRIGRPPPRDGPSIRASDRKMRQRLKDFARLVLPDSFRHWRAARFRARVARASTRTLTLTGGRVLGGPFAGMRYVDEAHCSQIGPKLLGTYERELLGVIDAIAALAPDRIVDAGAAEGYYAVGLLRLVAGSRVVAFEAEPAARSALEALAGLNDLRDRIDLRGWCGTAELAGALEGAVRPLLVMDIEGGEESVLDPEAVPRLRTTHIVVELHPHLVPSINETLTRRFASSHAVTRIAAVERTLGDLPVPLAMSRSDLRAVMWEGRPPGQSWLWMVPRP